MTKGLKQSCCILSTLFKKITEQTLWKWKIQCRNMGMNINGTSMFTLQFADDEVLLAEKENDLRNLTNFIKQ